MHTRPIVAAAEEFKPLPGMVRETAGNADAFSPASGAVPCFEPTGTGCPEIYRTWAAPSGQTLTRADLQKVLDDSGWQDVKITECHLSGDHAYCSAVGMVGAYRASVSIAEIQNWELRLNLRFPN